MTEAAEELEPGSTEYWQAINNDRREQRHDRAAQDIELLKRHGVTFTTRNGDVHLMIDHETRGQVDFWPTTGLRHGQAADKKGRGIPMLLDHLGISHEPIARFRMDAVTAAGAEA